MTSKIESKFHGVVVPTVLSTVAVLVTVGLSLYFSLKVGSEEINSYPCQQPVAMTCKPK